MTLNPGVMRDRISLLRRIGTDPWGDVPVSGHVTICGEKFIVMATVWTQYRPTRGREFREGSVPLGEQRAVFTVNYRETLTQVDRLVHLGRGGNHVWNIRSVEPVGFKDGTDIFAYRTDAGH